MSIPTPFRAPAVAPSPVAPLAVGGAAVVGTIVLGLGDPNTTHVPLCPFRAVTGLDCPFCGSLRAVHSLTHLDLLGALSHNLLFTLSVPALVGGWAYWLRSSIERPGAPLRPVPRLATVAFLVLVTAFFVLRNLPAFGWLGSSA